MYIHNSYKVKKYSFVISNDGHLEHLFVSLKINKISLLVGVVYRPPAYSLNESVLNFHSMLAEITPIFDCIFITGDINVNLLNLSKAL